MPELHARRLVAFGEAVIDVDTIIAMAMLPITVSRPLGGVAIMFDSGKTLTLDGRSMYELIYWWEENIKAEKVELPDGYIPEPIKEELEGAMPVATPESAVSPAVKTPPPTTPVIAPATEEAYTPPPRPASLTDAIEQHKPETNEPETPKSA